MTCLDGWMDEWVVFSIRVIAISMFCCLCVLKAYVAPHYVQAIETKCLCL